MDKVKDRDKTKEQLINELVELRERIAELETLEAQHKRIEEEFRINEEKYRMVAYFTYDWVYWCGTNGHYIYISPSCERITGYCPDEFLVDPDLLSRITHPDDRDTVTRHFRDALRGDGGVCHMDFRIITRNGEERWISHFCQPVYRDDGSWFGQLGSNRDITVRKRVEEALQKAHFELSTINDKLKAEIEVRKRAQKALAESEERYKRMVSAVTTYTYSVKTKEGRVILTQYSMGCLTVTGYNTKDYESDPCLWYTIIYPDDRMMIENSVKEILSGHKVPPIEHRIIRRDGAVVWVRNTMVSHYDEKGLLIGYHGLIEDITERKRAEEELKHVSNELARSNADLKEFAYVASHDLKKPLQSIEGFVKLLARRYKGKLDAKADELIEYIGSGVKRMQELIKDLLEYSQIGAKEKKFKPTDCSHVVEKAVGNLQAAIEESNALVTYDELPTIMVDTPQMISLFQNLIDNAIKFCGEEAPRIHISAERKGDEWVFSIRDNGIGIDPKDSERIFGMFQRLHGSTEYPGTGIGLAICKKIIERHGGRVWVESETGKGSTFYFTMPCAQ